MAQTSISTINAHYLFILCNDQAYFNEHIVVACSMTLATCHLTRSSERFVSTFYRQLGTQQLTSVNVVECQLLLLLLLMMIVGRPLPLSWAVRGIHVFKRILIINVKNDCDVFNPRNFQINPKVKFFASDNVLKMILLLHLYKFIFITIIVWFKNNVSNTIYIAFKNVCI